MSRFIALTKALLKTNGDSFIKKRGKFKLKGIVLLSLLIVCFLPLAISTGALVNTMYNALSPINQQGAVLGLGLSTACAAIFIFGIFYVMGTFYFSMDIEYLLPLPFRPWEILTSKLVVVLIYEYVTQLIILAPILITYGFRAGSGILYYIFCILIFFTLPIIPLIISSILIMILMRFTTFAKNKDRFNMFVGMIAVFLGLGINVLTQRTASTFTDPEKIQKLVLEGNNSLISMVTSAFPSAKLAAVALAENTASKGVINLLLFILITFAALVVFILIGEGLYLKGVMGVSQSASRRKDLSSDEISKATEENSSLKAYTLKELKLLFRTPAYFLNCVIINFLLPIFLILPLLAGPKEALDLSVIVNFVNNPNILPIILAASTVAVAFIATTNGIAATSISREGKNLYVNKFLPISYKTQIFSKVLSGIIMGLIGMIMVVIVLCVIAKPSILLVALILLIGLLILPFVNFVGMLIDLNNPKLDWDNEQKAVKQNMNVILSWLPCLAISGLLGFVVYKLGFTLTLSAVFLLVAYMVIDFILYKILSTKGVKLFSDL